jgi:hypothetical protein
VYDLVQRVDRIGQQLRAGDHDGACAGLSQFVGVISAAVHKHPGALDPGVASDWISRARHIGAKASC